MTTIANHGGRLLRLPQVCDITGVKRSMIYQMEAEHRFPRRIKIGARAVVWLKEETRRMATGDGDAAYAAYPCDGLAHSLRELLRGMPFFGMTRDVAELISGLSLTKIEFLVRQLHRHLRPRWEDQPTVWRHLLLATQTEDIRSQRAL